MTLTTYDRPFNLGELLDEMFEPTLSCRPRDLGTKLFPLVDIRETDDHFLISADMPGLNREDIDLRIENSVLTISGEKKQEVENREKNRYYHFERSTGRFSRSFNLPENVNSESIEAKFANGVLEIKLLKKEVVKPKAIEIKVG